MAALIKSIPVKGEVLLHLSGELHAASAGSVPAGVAMNEPENRQPAVAPALAQKGFAPPADAVAATGEAANLQLLREMYEKQGLELTALKQRESAIQALEDEAREKAYAEGFPAGEKAGYADGLEKGREKAEDDLRGELEALGSLIEAINANVASVVDQAETIIGAIVFEAAGKVVGSALASTEGALAAINAVVSRAKKHEIVSVRVSPDDYSRIASHSGAAVGEALEKLRALGLEADESVELGGAIVYLKGGHIDGRIETQFRSFAQSLKDAAQAAQKS